MKSGCIMEGVENQDNSPASVCSRKYGTVEVWSLSARLFHWSLVIFILSSAVSSLHDSWLGIHIILGFMVLCLVIWRTVYGFTGPYYSRFANFIVSPQKLLAHMKEATRFNPPLHIGHSAPHGWMIIAFFVAISLIFLSGLFIFYGEENQGWLHGAISFSQGEVFKDIHELLAYMLGLMVFIHLGGVLMDSILHKTNLVKSIITGEKTLPEKILADYQTELEPTKRSFTGILILCLALLFLGSVYYLTYWNQKTAIELGEAGGGRGIWQKECSDCHEAFHPSLLPERSWLKLMQGLESHFGDDASLDEDDVYKVTEFLVLHSAERFNTEAAYKINRSIPGEKSPISITETPYWIKKHNFIKGDVYARKSVKTKSRCSSCHLDAKSGAYEDSMITNPE